MKTSRFLLVLGAMMLGTLAFVAFTQPDANLLQVLGLSADPHSLLLLAEGAGALTFESKDVEKLHTELSKSLKEHVNKTQDTLDKAVDEVKRVGTLQGQTNDELKKLGEKTTELQQRLQEIEQKAATRPAAGGGEAKSIGQRVVESDEYKSVSSAGGKIPNMAPVQVGSFFKAITNATGQNQPLVVSDRLEGIVTPAERLLTIRSLIPVGTTQSNLIEYAKENVFTNNAGPQYSSPNRENVAKAESNITFTLANAPVVTIAHWIAASRQVLTDAGMLRSYIDSRMSYGLKLEEEDEILNGDGSAGVLNGLLNQATAYNRGATGDQQLDTLLKAMLQVTLSEYVADGVVLNHIDWTNILLLKDTQGRYLFGDPGAQQAPRVWGRPVVPTNSIGESEFLVGAFTMGAQLWDREDASIRIAEQHQDFFIKNMVAILAEERVALTVYRPAAMVTGQFE